IGKARFPEQLTQLPIGVDPLIALSLFHLALPDESVLGFETTIGKVVAIGNQQVNVNELIPAPLLKCWQNRFGKRPELDQEVGARLQSAADRLEKVGVALVVEVAETVAATERAVEPTRPRQFAHVALFEHRGEVLLGGSGLSFLNEGQSKVHARRTEAT